MKKIVFLKKRNSSDKPEKPEKLFQTLEFKYLHFSISRQLFAFQRIPRIHPSPMHDFNKENIYLDTDPHHLPRRTANYSRNDASSSLRGPVPRNYCKLFETAPLISSSFFEPATGPRNDFN